jgi:hypothetical protein
MQSWKATSTDQKELWHNTIQKSKQLVYKFRRYSKRIQQLFCWSHSASSHPRKLTEKSIYLS